MRIASIGEILWDVLPTGEHLGGAPFNFALQAHQLGNDVRFLSAVGDDDRGMLAIDRAATLGLNVDFVQKTTAATGIVTVDFDDKGEPHYNIHRPAAYDALQLTQTDLMNLARFDPDWIYFGSLFAMDAHARGELSKALRAAPRAGRFCDVNLRPQSYKSDFIQQLLRSAHVVKMNEDEARTILGHYRDAASACGSLMLDYDLDAVCITRGAGGSAAFIHGQFVEAPAYPVKVADPVGAGDAFAAAFLHGYGQKWSPMEILDFANRAGANAASHAGATGA